MGSYYGGRGRGRGLYHNDNIHSAGSPQFSKQQQQPQPPRQFNQSQPPPPASFHPLAISSQASMSNNQSFTISVNLDLDPYGLDFHNKLKHFWSLYKNSPFIVTMLKEHFEQCFLGGCNPYEQALRLMFNCLDFKYAKPKAMCFMIMEVFKEWSVSERARILSQLTADLKISAFNVVRQQSFFALMKLVAETYEMARDCDIFLGIIKQMIHVKQYKEACQSCALLGLHNKFGIEEFLVPLILQDKLPVVEEFLADSVAHQHDLVSFLDQLIGSHGSIRSSLDSFVVMNNVPQIKYEKLHYKPWRKLITRLIKLYKLSEEYTPNLNKKRNEGALQFLINKKYTDNTFGNESFREMVHEAVKDDEKLQLELVIQIAHFSDTAEALRYAHLYNVPKANWPFSVRLLNDNPDNNRHLEDKSAPSNLDECWDSPKCSTINYLKHELPTNLILVVDNIPSFENFLDNLSEVDIVGIDCEWKPSFGIHRSELALLQLATRKSIYILDIIKLGSQARHLWQELGNFLFNNCDILKLGFSLTGDMSMMRAALPHLNLNMQEGFLDLLTVWKQIDKSAKIKFPFEVSTGGPSLATLVHMCLGAPLDKSDQFSNWEKRPLRQSQIEYAALDAYCLIQVYDVLKKCCDSVGFAFDDMCYTLMSSSSGVTKKKSKKHLSRRARKSTENVQDLPQPPSPHLEPVAAKQMALVCDTMLQGLGKALRRCGVDTVILENNEEHMNCVKYYQDEQRYILTRGNIFNRLCGNVVAGHCLKILSDDMEEQLKQVLDYYKIIVTKDNVFSRCMTCNSNSFIKISKSTMSALVSSSRDTAPTPIDSQARCGPPCYTVDEATGYSSEEDYYDDHGDNYGNTDRSYYSSAPSVSRKWDLYSDEHVDVGLCLTRGGAKIQVGDIPPGILDKLDIYYVCESCGKVYWDGGHYEKALAGCLQGIVLK